MYVYVVLSHTGSIPSKVIRHVTRDNYTHVSISLDYTLTKMYSFGRKYLYSPYPAGFIEENIHDGLYKLKKNVFISVYKIKVSNQEFEYIYNVLKSFKANGEIYFYDYLGALGVYLGKNLFKRNGYICSSFVSDILNEAGILVDMESWRIRPQHFSSINKFELIYEGLSSCYKTSSCVRRQSKEEGKYGKEL